MGVGVGMHRTRTTVRSSDRTVRVRVRVRFQSSGSSLILEFEFGLRFGRNKCSLVAHKILTLHRAYPIMSRIRTNIKSHAPFVSNQFVFSVWIDDRFLSKVLMIFSGASFYYHEIILLNKERNHYFPFEQHFCCYLPLKILMRYSSLK